jgi:hypothetical protein
VLDHASFARWNAQNVRRSAARLLSRSTSTWTKAVTEITVENDLLALGESQGIAVIKPGELWPHTTG